MIFIFSAEVSEFECDELLDDIKASKKDTTLRLALSRLASDFGRESMLSLQRFCSSRRAPVISTSSLKLDIALGVGGLLKVIIQKAKFFSCHIFCVRISICVHPTYMLETGRFLVHYTKRDVWTYVYDPVRSAILILFFDTVS